MKKSSITKDLERVTGVPSEFSEDLLLSFMDVTLHMMSECLVTSPVSTKLMIPMLNWGVISCDFDEYPTKIEFSPSDELLAKLNSVSQGVSPLGESELLKLIAKIQLSYSQLK